MAPFPQDHVEALLPWFIHDTLDPEDRAAVEQHLAACSACRDALETERAMAATLPLPTRAPSPDAGWVALVARLPSAPLAPAAPRRRSSRDRSSPRRAVPPQTWQWIAAAQVAVIGALGAALWAPGVQPGGDAGRYRALGAATVRSPGRILVLFRPNTEQAAVGRLLADNRLRIVDGPTEAGAYVLSGDGSPAAALAGLRRSPAVAMAEPLGSADRP